MVILSPQALKLDFRKALHISSLLDSRKTQSSRNFHQCLFPASQLKWLPVGSWIEPKLINLKFKSPFPLSVQPQLPLFQPDILFTDPRQDMGWGLTSVPSEDRVEEWLGV